MTTVRDTAAARPLDGKVAVVTGGTSGIGAAVVRRLAELGCVVASLGRDAGRAEALAADLPEGAAAPIFVPVDLAQPSSLPQVVDDLLTRFGRIDILVNAAGATGPSQSVLEATEEDWDRAYNINIKAPFLLIQAVGRHMSQRPGGGRIINFSSSSAFRAAGGGVSYPTAKAAVCQLTRHAASILAPFDVNVNTVVPGATRTGMTAHYGNDQLDQAVRAGPLANLFQRVSEPEDAAALVVFLCLPESRQITAQTLHVSAGAVV